MSDECGVEPLYSRALFQGHGVPTLSFLEAEMDRLMVLDSDPQFIGG